MVQWLRRYASNARGMGSIPGWELRSHTLCSAAKKEKLEYKKSFCKSAGIKLATDYKNR